MTQAARFREMLRRDGMVVAPGAYDCITARLSPRRRGDGGTRAKRGRVRGGHGARRRDR
jgi:hypothetical protein